MKDVNRYMGIDTVELIANSYDKVPKVVEPERTVVRFYIGSRIKRIYAFRYCYLDRANLKNKGRSGNKHIAVNLSSLCLLRRKAIERWIKAMITGEDNLASSRVIGSLFDWIDLQKRNEDLFDQAAVKILYLDYTNELLNQVMLSNVGGKKGKARDYASSLQRCLRILIKHASGIPLTVVESWAPKIRKRMSENSLPQPRLSDAQAQLAFELHTRLFMGYSDIVLSDRKAPCSITLDDLGFENLVLFGFLTSNYQNWGAKEAYGGKTWHDFAYSNKGFDTDWESVRLKAESEGVSLPEKGIAGYKSTRHILNKNNMGFLRSDLAHFSNRAVKHFAHMLLLAAGCNADHFDGIDFTRTRLSKGVGASRIIAFKGRSSNELQSLSVSAQFSKYWKALLSLREWMSEFHATPLPNHGLFVFSQTGSHTGSYRLLNSETVKQALIWPKSAPELLTRTGRKIKIQKSLEINGSDITSVAGMVSNKEDTIRKHYGFRRFEESAKELSHFFEAMHRSANIRVSGLATAPIVHGGKKTTTGRCTAASDDDRVYIDGIDDSRAPELNCRSPLACFFCDSFGIHANIEDIKRVLSVKPFIKLQSRNKSQSIKDHEDKFLPISYRIDEIIDAFSELDRASLEIVKTAKKEIDEGRLDECNQHS